MVSVLLALGQISSIILPGRKLSEYEESLKTTAKYYLILGKNQAWMLMKVIEGSIQFSPLPLNYPTVFFLKKNLWSILLHNVLFIGIPTY
jgi:hypothetical protein